MDRPKGNSALITDLRHFLDEKGAIGPTAGPGRKLAEFLTRIVAEATATALTTEELALHNVRCRSRKCRGIIDAYWDTADDSIFWLCRACGDRGIIRNWKGSVWDCSDQQGSH